MVTERPVLVVPFVGVARTPGKKVLLCWNGSRESARAATGALPILRTAESVVVLIVDPKTNKLINAGRETALADARAMTPQAVADWLAGWVG